MPPHRTGTAYEKNNKWNVGVRLREVIRMVGSRLRGDGVRAAVAAGSSVRRLVVRVESTALRHRQWPSCE